MCRKIEWRTQQRRPLPVVSSPLKSLGRFLHWFYFLAPYDDRKRASGCGIKRAELGALEVQGRSTAKILKAYLEAKVPVMEDDNALCCVHWDKGFCDDCRHQEKLVADAAKSDDAPIPVELWNDWIVSTLSVEWEGIVGSLLRHLQLSPGSQDCKFHAWTLRHMEFS